MAHQRIELWLIESHQVHELSAIGEPRGPNKSKRRPPRAVEVEARVAWGLWCILILLLAHMSWAAGRPL